MVTGTALGFCENGDEHSSYMEGRTTFLRQPSDCQLLKKYLLHVVT